MKKSLFLENTKLLNNQFNIVPLMYGSLGLEYITNENLNSDDIDILIPEVFLKERWNEFKEILFQHNYHLIDEKEHTFVKDNIYYSYASFEELSTFIKINLSDIKVIDEFGSSFKALSLEQYLLVYSSSIKDGYRINVRKKKDEEKIKLIKKYLGK